MNYKVADLATLVGGKLVGEGGGVITDTRSLTQGHASAISFAVGEYREHAGEAIMGALLVEGEPIEGLQIPQIVVDNGKVAFSKILELYHPPVVIPRTIHSTAVIGENVSLGQNVSIGAYAVIQDNAVIGDNVTIYPQCYVGHTVRIGADTVLYPGAVVHENCVLGERVVLRAHAVVGGEGFGFATKDGKHTHVPQVGNVILEDDVEVGSCSCIDNATMGSTMVRRGTKIDNLVHLGHNVEIGEDCFIIAQVGIAGSTKCGNHVTFAGQTGCVGHITIGDNVTFGGKTGIIGNIPSNGVYAGFPAQPHRDWLRINAYEKKLPDMARELKELKARLQALEEKREEV